MLSSWPCSHLFSNLSWVFVLSSLGSLFIMKHFISLLKWAYIYFLRPQKDLKKYGSWALVTGSTDGIGKALAFQLAQKGLNLILVSRNHEKLEQVSTEIREKLPDTQIKIIVFDFSCDLASGIRGLEEGIQGLDVGMLINTVGITYPSAMYFHEVDETVWMKVVRVNLEATTWVTRVVLKGMVKREKGLIVNIGSGAGIVVPSHPLYATYAATKAYISKLSRSLQVEYNHFGIDVQCQLPLYVATKMLSRLTSTEKASLLRPTAEDYAAAAICRLGYEPWCTPYWAHSLQWCMAKLLPEPVLDAWRLSTAIQRRKLASSRAG
ncbi:hypothetical protein Ancab_021287 [Ancistrocladus abbreviatus]